MNFIGTNCQGAEKIFRAKNKKKTCAKIKAKILNAKNEFDIQGIS